MCAVKQNKSNCALVALPWQLHDNSSIQLGALTAFLRSKNIKVDSFHLYQDFFHYLSRSDYYTIHSSSTGEGVFAALLFPERREQIVSAINSTCSTGLGLEEIISSCSIFIEESLSKVSWDLYSCIGFSVSHEQLICSLVLAKAIKNKFPNIAIVFGGALIDQINASGLLACFSFVDIACFGEGETIIYSLIKNYEENKSWIDLKIPGVACRTKNGTVLINEKSNYIKNLDDLPIPDYTDLFRSVLGEQYNSIPRLAIEISRGCSWGKCAFCNLSIQWNGSFRKKTDERISLEIQNIIRKYKSSRIIFADTNVAHFSSAFKKVARNNLGIDAFAEVSAHISRDDFISLRSAGVRSIQVGIESFSDAILKKFNKGTTVFSNLEILKLAAEYSVKIGYNIIMNYPGETQDDIEENFRVMQYAKYFEPPSLIDFSLSYNSPAFINKNTHNVSDWDIPSYYKMVYPIDVLERIAPMILLWLKPIPEKELKTDWSKIVTFVKKWRQKNVQDRTRKFLTYRDSGNFLMVNEINESDKIGRTWRIEGFARDIYLKCDKKTTSINELCASLPICRAKIVEILQKLDSYKILFYSKGRAFSLAYRQT